MNTAENRVENQTKVGWQKFYRKDPSDWYNYIFDSERFVEESRITQDSKSTRKKLENLVAREGIHPDILSYIGSRPDISASLAIRIIEILMSKHYDDVDLMFAMIYIARRTRKPTVLKYIAIHGDLSTQRAVAESHYAFKSTLLFLIKSCKGMTMENAKNELERRKTAKAA